MPNSQSSVASWDSVCFGGMWPSLSWYLPIEMIQKPDVTDAENNEKIKQVGCIVFWFFNLFSLLFVLLLLV